MIRNINGPSGIADEGAMALKIKALIRGISKLISSSRNAIKLETWGRSTCLNRNPGRFIRVQMNNHQPAREYDTTKSSD